MTNPKHAPRAKRTPFVLLILGLLAGGMCLLLALNTASAANEVARHDLTADDQSAAAQLVDLENRVQASAAPANLAAAAAALGMVPAGNPGFLKIGKDDTVRVMGSAQPASLEPVVIPHPAPTATKTKTAGKKPAGHKTPAAKNTTTAAATTTATSTTTPAKSRGTTETKAAGRAAGAPAAPTSSASSTAPPSPTPTPTPETTLPGGNR